MLNANIIAMQYTGFFIAAFITTTALVGALPSLESREDNLDTNFFTLSEVPENNLGTTTANIDAGLSDLDSSSSLVALSPDDSSASLFDDLGSPSLLPADDMTISDSLVSSCLAPASKKRDLSNEDLLLLCKTPRPSLH